MPRKSPIGKIKDVAFDTIKDPVGTAGKAAGRAVGQARDSVALGRTVAGHVSRGAYGLVRSRLVSPGHGQSGDAAPVVVPEPPATSDRAVPAEEPLKDQGDALATPPARKRPAKKTPATKTPATKAPAKKTAKKTAPEVTATPADVAEKVAKKAPAKKATTKKTAAKASAKKSPAEKAAAKTAPKPPSTTSSPSAKLPAKKSPAKKPAAKKAAKKAPLSAAELAAGAGTETITPVGTRGADVSTNPDTTDTDLQQPGTEPLMDPATTKAVASEAKTLGRASDAEKS